MIRILAAAFVAALLSCALSSHARADYTLATIGMDRTVTTATPVCIMSGPTCNIQLGIANLDTGGWSLPGSVILPVPSPTQLGGVFSATAPANQFQTGINTTGTPTFAQPTIANIAPIAPNSILGNATGSSATPQALTTLPSTFTGTSGHLIPYLDGANTWSGVQTIPAPVITGNSIIDWAQAGTGAVTTTVQAKLRQVEVALEDYKSPVETSYDNAFTRVVAAYPSAIAIIGQPGATYNFTAPVVISRSNIEWRCKAIQSCTIEIGHSGTGLAINDGTSIPVNVTTSTGSVTATVSSSSGLTNGMYISSANIPEGTTFTISGTTLTLSIAATGNGTNAAVAGNKVYNIKLDEFVVTRTVAAASGCDVSIRNGAQFYFTNDRFYSASNSISSICATSVQDIYVQNVRSEHVKGPALTFDGVGYGLDGFESQTVGVYIDQSINYFVQEAAVGGVAAGAGAIEFGDYAQGIFVRRALVAQSPAYGIALRGSVASVNGANSLVFVEDVNIESDPSGGGGGGGIYTEYYHQLIITHGWMGGYSGPALYTGPNSSDTQMTGVTVYEHGSGAFAVACHSSTDLTGNQFIAYAGSQYAVGVYSGCSVNLVGGSIRQFTGGVYEDASASNANSITSVVGVNFADTTYPMSSVIYGWGRTTIIGASTNTGAYSLKIGAAVVSLPTSCAGLLPGALWNNANVVNICP